MEIIEYWFPPVFLRQRCDSCHLGGVGSTQLLRPRMACVSFLPLGRTGRTPGAISSTYQLMVRYFCHLHPMIYSWIFMLLYLQYIPWYILDLQPSKIGICATLWKIFPPYFRQFSKSSVFKHAAPKSIKKYVSPILMVNTHVLWTSFSFI